MLRLYDNRIRPIAVSIIRKDNEILVYQRQDDCTNEKFYRFVGGGIEFSEEAEIALKREFIEELSIEIEEISLISIFESLFTFNNKKKHEVVFLYQSKFKNKRLYEEEEFIGLEGEREFTAVWKPITDFLSNKETLYPKEVIKFL